MTVSVGLLVMMTAKPGQEAEVAQFLTDALPLAEREPDTRAWFAVRIDESTFGIVDFFPDDDGRSTHLNGPIAAALMQRAPDLFAGPPQIRPLDVLAAKLPDATAPGNT